MNKQTLLFWKDRYEQQDDPFSAKEEKTLSKRIQANKLVTKKDLERIINWKFQGLPGRRKRFLNLLKSVKDVEKVSKAAFQVDDDEIRLQILSSIKG
ncbi:hypothetical protein JXC34_03310, partial [Candidatus Woesearchaeota archaeon]|nr:hypothetical protein [Candidatus Woesearchaeota archaeon]